MTRADSQAATLQASATITRAVAALEAGLFCNTPSQSDAGVAHAKEALQEIEVQTLMLPLPCNTPRTGCGILPLAACLSESQGPLQSLLACILTDFHTASLQFANDSHPGSSHQLVSTRVLMRSPQCCSWPKMAVTKIAKHVLFCICRIIYIFVSGFAESSVSRFEHSGLISSS